MTQAGAFGDRHKSAANPRRQSRRHLLAILVLMMACVPGLRAQPPVPPTMTPLTELDQQYMDRQRALIDELSRRHLGRSCCKGVEELDLLQRLLDEEVVRADQRLELQAMGVILGDILAGALDMDWVIYEDELGRSRALRLGNTSNLLFPVTMISRRREAGNMESIEEIFNGAYMAIEPLKPRRPYQ